jgi:hypothetical protein
MMSVATEQAVPESAAAVLTGPALDERICQFLVAKGRLKETDLVRGRRLHEEDPSGRLIALLTRLGLVSERDMADAVAEVMQLPLLASKDLPEAPPANVQLSVRFLKHHHVVPIGETESEVKLLIADPADHYPLEAIALATGRKVSLSVGLRPDIDDLIERYYGQGRSAMGSIVESLSEDNARSEDDIEHLRDLASEAPVIRLVNLSSSARWSCAHRTSTSNRSKPAQGALPHRWRAGRGRVAAGGLDRRGDLSASRSWPSSTSPSAAAAGWPHHDARAGQGTRPARQHRADRAWRIGGDAPADREPWCLISRLGFTRRVPAASSRRCWSCRTASCWSPAPPDPARPPRCTRR